MLVEYDVFGDRHDKVADAIQLLQRLEPEDGYYVAFSGGKDSQCVYHLCKMAGVKFDAHYSVTTVDPPELVQFIKRQYPDAWEARNRTTTMWKLIPERLMPPTRIVRYCCDELKEACGHGRVTVTGVRWAESANRKANQGMVTIIGASKSDKAIMEGKDANFTQTNRGGVVLNNDNDTTRDVVEMCFRKRKTLVNPIITWEDADVWEFLNEVAKVPHCELYDKGCKRLGCIGCPMSSANAAELDRYPKYKAAYLKAFANMLQERKKRGLQTEWKTAEDVMAWWLTGKAIGKVDGQITIDELLGS